MSENPTQISLLLDALFQYGAVWVYLIIFTACFIENFFPPFPGDSFIVAAGGLVALQRLDFLLTMAMVLAGGIVSVMILYRFGDIYGRGFFQRKNYRYFSVKDIATMETKLKKWGAVVLIASRFLVGIRAVLAVAAGIGRFPLLKMFLYSTISYILFTLALMYLAIGAVENLESIETYFREYHLIIWPLVILLVSAYFINRLMALRRGVE